MNLEDNSNPDAEIRQCLNCEHSFVGRFCPACGQDSDQKLRPLTAALREVVDALGAFDFRFLTTLRLLLTSPGRVTRDVLDGRRQRYTPPLRLYIVTSAITIALMSVTGFVAFDSIFQNMGPAEVERLQELTGVQDFDDPAFRERLDRRFNTLFPLFNLLTPLGLTLALKVVHPRTLLQAHAITALHLGTAQVAYSTALLPAFRLGRTAIAIVSVALILGISTYAWFMLRRVYGGSKFATALRCLALAATFLIVGSLINSLTMVVVLATV